MVTVESLCCTLETNVRLYINYSSILKKSSTRRRDSLKACGTSEVGAGDGRLHTVFKREDEFGFILLPHMTEYPVLMHLIFQRN